MIENIFQLPLHIGLESRRFLDIHLEGFADLANSSGHARFAGLDRGFRVYHGCGHIQGFGELLGAVFRAFDKMHEFVECHVRETFEAHGNGHVRE